MIALALLFLAAPATTEARGADGYRTCAACHDPKPGALGPDLKGVIGRKAGTLPGFRFSGPLQRSGIVWTPQNLRGFIIDPQAVIPGNRMPFAGVTASEASDIATYIELGL